MSHECGSFYTYKHALSIARYSLNMPTRCTHSAPVAAAADNDNDDDSNDDDDNDYND